MHPTFLKKWGYLYTYNSISGQVNNEVFSIGLLPYNTEQLRILTWMNHMNAIEALTQRVSVAQLTGPDVPSEQVAIMLQAALRAADHGWLRPSRFLTIQGEHRDCLGKIFLESTENWQDLPVENQHKLRHSPMRAPLIIVAICNIQDHPKVPALEQLLSTGAAVQNIVNAAFALGLGAIWRTGAIAHNRKVADALGLTASEQIVGFVYVGHNKVAPKAPPVLDLADFVTDWKPKIV